MTQHGRWLAGLVLVGVACSSQSPSEVRAAEVYVAAIRWTAGARSDDPDPLHVYVESRGEGTAIKLEVQAEVVNSSADVAEVRFIDARDEAVTDGDDGQPVVRDGGILVRLGPVVEAGDQVRLEVDRWVADHEFETYELVLHQVGDSWELTGEPTVTGVIELSD